MKKRQRIYLLLLMLTVSPVFLIAQEKYFTLEDYMNRDIYPESLSNLRWVSGTDMFTFTESNALVCKAAGNDVHADTLLHLSDLNAAGKNIGMKELHRFPGITWRDALRFYFMHDNKIFIYDFSDSTLSKTNEFPDNAENLEVEPSSLSVAYTVGNNLFVSVEGDEMQVSEQDDPDIVLSNRRIVFSRLKMSQFLESCPTMWPSESLVVILSNLNRCLSNAMRISKRGNASFSKL
jgi:dipeptidyl-peptidase-4